MLPNDIQKVKVERAPSPFAFATWPAGSDLGGTVDNAMDIDTQWDHSFTEDAVTATPPYTQHDSVHPVGKPILSGNTMDALTRDTARGIITRPLVLHCGIE